MDRVFQIGPIQFVQLKKTFQVQGAVNRIDILMPDFQVFD